MKIRDLKGSGVPIVFGPISEPEKFKIDLLEEASRRLSLDTIDFNELELEIGDRLEERPYPNTGRTTMPSHYLAEGSVWLDFIAPDGRRANISLVPFFHGARLRRGESPHHNFWLYWTNFDRTIDSDDRISGHVIPIDAPIVIRISCGEETRKGTINIKR